MRAGKGETGKGAGLEKTRRELTAVAFEGWPTKTKAQQNYIPRQAAAEHRRVLSRGPEGGAGFQNAARSGTKCPKQKSLLNQDDQGQGWFQTPH